MPADPTPKLAEARAAEPNMSDLRHTWEPISRYTCPACGEVLLRRDPNDLCPVKVALRLATKDAEVDRLTAKLAEARAMGRREGLEEAAKECRELAYHDCSAAYAATCIARLAAKVTP